MKTFKQNIINLLKESRINTAILRLSEIIEDEKLNSDLILIESGYNRLIAADLANIQKFDDLDRHYSKITKDLLSILNSLDSNKIIRKSNFEEIDLLKKEIDLLLLENKRLKNQFDKSLGIIKGKRLFQYKGMYPIDLEPVTDIPSLNREKYIEAIKFLLRDDIHDRLAASDIVYLRKDNLDHDEDILDDKHIELYAKLVEKYDLYEFIKNFKNENELILGNYARIVNEFGKTLDNCFIEILLHNVRNPLKSVIAAQNTTGISDRRLFDPSTRFVIEYVQHQGKHLIKAFEGKGKVSYEKVFKNGKIVKATTTPVFDSRYGLVGIICVNIDIEAVKNSTNSKDHSLIESYCQISTKGKSILRNIQ